MWAFHCLLPITFAVVLITPTATALITVHVAVVLEVSDTYSLTVPRIWLEGWAVCSLVVLATRHCHGVPYQQTVYNQQQNDQSVENFSFHSGPLFSLLPGSAPTAALRRGSRCILLTPPLPPRDSA